MTTFTSYAKLNKEMIDKLLDKVNSLNRNEELELEYILEMKKQLGEGK